MRRRKTKVMAVALLRMTVGITTSGNLKVYASEKSTTNKDILEMERTEELEEEEYLSRIEKEFFNTPDNAQENIDLTINEEKQKVSNYNNNSRASSSTLKIHFIPIGNGTNGEKRGDAIFIECDGEYALIDAGLKGNNCNTYLNEFMKGQGLSKINLKCAVLTHHHADHFGGFCNIADNSKITVSKFYEPKVHTKHAPFIGKNGKIIDSGCGAQSYSTFKDKIKSKWSCDVIPTLSTDSSKIDNVANNETKTVKVKIGTATLHMYKILTETADDNNWNASKFENNRSILCRIDFAGKRILLTGDVYMEMIQRFQKLGAKMGNKNVQLAANDLKIQHHGILSTFNDTIKSQYTDGFKANRFVISNSRKEPDANGTNGWGTGAIDRNTFLKSKYGSSCIKSTAYGAQVFTYIN